MHNTSPHIIIYITEINYCCCYLPSNLLSILIEFTNDAFNIQNCCTETDNLETAGRELRLNMQYC